MKKILCVFTACRPNIMNKEDDDYKVNLDVDKNITATLRILIPNTDGGQEEKYMDALVPGFNELYPNVTVEYDRRAISDSKYAESISSAIASGEVPDLFYTNTVYYYYLVSKNCIVSLEPYYAAEEQLYKDTNGEE